MSTGLPPLSTPERRRHKVVRAVSGVERRRLGCAQQRQGVDGFLSFPNSGLRGAAALLLLFIGIHNSWDTVTYIAIDLKRRDKPSPPSP